MESAYKKPLLVTSIIVLAVAVGFGFYQYGGASAADEVEVVQTAAPQAKPVDVALIETKPVQIWKTFSARMEAVDYAEIRPQVTGIITEVRFEDGQEVNKGDVLFVIDPRQFEAEVKEARALLNASKIETVFARKKLKRAKGLIKSKAVSESLLDERNNSVDLSRTNIEVAEASLMQAEINLDRAYVKAPISGRISRAEIKVGNLVSAGANAPLLTSVVSSKGIYADFDVDEKTYLKHIHPVAKTRSAEHAIPVKLQTSVSDHIFEGFVYSFDNRINATSGTIRARAYFGNTENNLLPGMFGTVQIGSAVIQNHILVNETAIGTNQDRKFVYIIDEKGLVQYRQVTLGNMVAGKRIITNGLNGGETIITGGLMRIRPGMPVVARDETETPAS